MDVPSQYFPTGKSLSQNDEKEPRNSKTEPGMEKMVTAAIILLGCLLFAGIFVCWSRLSNGMESSVLSGNIARMNSLLQQDPACATRCFDDGSTPLSRAAAAGNVASVEILIEHGADVNQQEENELGGTALKWAALWGRTEVCKYLLDHGADINQKCSFGWTSLHEAARCSDASVLKLLLSRKAEVDVQNPSGWTALHIAAADGKLDAVTLLVKAGACLRVRNGDGHTALDLASAGNHPDVVRFLSQANSQA